MRLLRRAPTALITLVVLTVLIAGRSRMASAGGEELIGTAAPEFTGLAWPGGHPLTVAGLRGRVVLIRFWTDGCPYCAHTAPALNDLHRRYGRDGLTVIGIYHPKPPGPRSEAAVTAAVRRLGFQFPVAIDANWDTLRRWWLDRSDRAWTSVSFLLDRHGRIRFIHPGGEYYPGEGAPGRDYESLRAAIERLLAEPAEANRAVKGAS
jgi:thiol-disulfide isomerase/thioredoxin